MDVATRGGDAANVVGISEIEVQSRDSSLPVDPLTSPPLGSPSDKPLIHQDRHAGVAATAGKANSQATFHLPQEALGGDFDLLVMTFSDPDAEQPDSPTGERMPNSNGDITVIARQEEVSQREFNARVSRAAEAMRGDAGQLFAEQPPLSTWDLRLVLPLGQASRTATVALRRGALLVSFPPMRGVLTASKCFVLLEEGADGDIALLKSQFRERSSGEHDADRAPFAARVLAAMLDVARADLAREVAHVGSAANAAMKRSSHDESQVASIHHVEDDLGALTTVLESVQAALSRFDGYALRAGALAGDPTTAWEDVAADGLGGSAPAGLEPPRPVARMRSRWDVRPSVTQGGADAAARAAFVFNALQQTFNDFGMPVEAMLSTTRALRQKLAAAKGRANITLAQKRNTILRFSIQIQLVTAVFAASSVVSGWFGACRVVGLQPEERRLVPSAVLCPHPPGMNLDNGGCGPDGCHDWLAADHGWVGSQARLASFLRIYPRRPSFIRYQRFIWITTTTTAAAIFAAVVVWLYIRRHI